MKLLIFGVDGMSMNFVKKHLDKFNTLRQGMEQGCFSTMISPSKRGDKWNTSMDIWTSFYTGLSADEHGLGGKYVRDMNNTKVVMEKSKSVSDLEPEVKDKFFWNVMNKRGYKVGLFNGISTNPAFELDGFMYADFPQLTPYFTDFWYPKNLHNCWVKNKMEGGQPKKIQELGLNINKVTPDNVKQVYDTIGPNYFSEGVSFTDAELTGHFETITNMIKEVPVDVLFYYNLRLDLIQHFCFHDPEEKLIIQAYQVFESMLDKMIKQFNPDNILVVSDHGLERSEKGRVGAVPVPGVKDTNICLSINKCVLSGKHSEEATFIMWGKDVKDKGEIKTDIIGAYNKILEVCK